MISPEEIETAAKIAKEAAEHPETIIRAGEKIASEGKSVLGKVGGFVKGTAKTAAIAGTGAEIENLAKSNSTNSDTNDDSAESIANNPQLNVNSLRGIEESGQTLTPTNDSADNIAASITSADVSSLEGSDVNRSSPPRLENSKLDKIITILSKINASNHNIATGISRGFSNMHQDSANDRKAKSGSEQVQRIEGHGKGKSGGFLGNIVNHPIAAGIKSIAIGTLAATAAGAVAAVVQHRNDANTDTSTQGAIGDTDDLIQASQNKYGSSWATEIVKNAEANIDKVNGLSLANKDEQVKAIYLDIKASFDKATEEQKAAIVDAIAKMLKMSDKDVQSSIDDANSFMNAKVDPFEVGAFNAGVHAASGATSMALSGFAKIDKFIGAGFDKIGLHSLAKTEYEKADIDEATKSGVKSGENELISGKYNSKLGNLEAINHPTATSVGSYSMDAAIGAIGATTLGGAVGMGALGVGMGFAFDDPAKDRASLVKKASGLGMNVDTKDDADTEAKKKEAIEFFKSRGWTENQAIGIVANLMAESHLNPKAVGDGNKAYGIAQWHPVRQAKFKELTGKSIKDSTFGEQLAFVDWELHNTEKAAGDALSQTTSASDAAFVIDAKYERPADIAGQGLARSQRANQIQEELNPAIASKTIEPPSIPVNSGVASSGSPVVAPVTLNQGSTSINNQTNIDASSAVADPHLLRHVRAT